MKTPEQMAEDILHGVGKVASELWGDDEQAKKFAEAIRGTWLAGYQAAQPQWISVKKRLPEDGVEVIVVSDGTACASWHEAGDFGWSVGGKVTHWMPLPEAPKEEK